MTKRALLAAPILAAVMMWQPAMGQQDTNSAADRAANQADRAINNAGNEVNRAADRTGDAAAGAADRGADAAGAQAAGARQQGSKDQKFATRTSDMNNFEIQAGQLAQERAQSQEVKDLAKMTIQDHQQAQQQLQQIAQKKGMTLSDQLGPVHQAMLSELRQMEGQDFEKAYVYGQVAGHTKAVLKLRDAQTELQDPELKQYASQILPKVRSHLQHAQQIAKADEAITAGARIGGEERSTDTDSPAARPGAGTSDQPRSSTGGGNSAGQDQPGRTGTGAGPSGAGNEGTSGRPAGTPQQ